MKRKKALLVLAVLVLLAVLGVGAAAAWHAHHAYSDYGRVMQANWGFALPKEARIKEVFQADSGPGFHGDGIRCHVFSYENAGPIRDMVPWQSEEQNTRFGESYSVTAEKWLHEIEVPEEERPDYGACVQWYQRDSDTDEMLLYWNQEQGRLYVLESFL